MIIEKINKIRDYAIFLKYDWNGAQKTFKTFNLIYGWNYSGKTTLSRIFRSYETNSLHPDYPNASFEIIDSDGNKYTNAQLTTNLSIRVFNSDFILDNLKWAKEIEPIFHLGQANITLQEELESEKKKLEETKTKSLEIITKKESIENHISNALTDKARDIKNLLSIPNYFKRNFQPEVEKFVENNEIPFLSDEEISSLISTYKSTDKKDTISNISLSFPNILTMAKEVELLLKAKVQSTVIERLKNNPELNEWVRKGKDIHQGKTICEFCGNILPTDLLVNLSNHFSKDYDILLSNIAKQISLLNSSKINITLPDSAHFYSELQMDYRSLKDKIVKEILLTNNIINDFISILESKKTKAFEEISLVSFEYNADSLNNYIEQANDIIGKHNAKTTEFELEKEKAFSKLIDNYANEFAQKEKYSDSQKTILLYEQNINEIESQISLIENRILDLESQLSETVKGAEKINDYLMQYFGKEDLRIVVTQDNKFQLFRKDKVAKNLSEGEKTAIAFAYFIAKLEDKNTTLSETIIYIDDPISSLDSNHLFNTYSFIRTKFFDETTKPRSLKCKQLFISTHNYEFFNLIKDWYMKVKEAAKSFYLLERIANDTKDETVIKELPILLLKYKSEYVYLFSIVYNFSINPNKDFEQLYNLPNVIRRLLETFSAFKFLSTRNVDENLEHLIQDAIKCERVRKFVHYHSHSLSTNRIIQFSDINECSEVVSIVLDSIEKIDKIHYESLIQEINNPLVE